MPSQSQGKRRLTPQDGATKRFRVSRACDQCRTAREKCDGNQPICLPCVESKRACTYTSVQRKRGLQPGYIRSLETTLAFIFQSNPEIEDLVNTQLTRENSVLLVRGTKDSNRLHKSWTKSKFCRAVTKLLSGEHVNSDNEKAPTSDDDSEVDVEDATLLRDSRGQSRGQGPFVHETTVTVDIPRLPVEPNVRTTPTQQAGNHAGCISLPSDCWKLLETYATYTQCWLPMCEQLDALKLSYSYPEQGLALSATMPNSGDHAEMWSILAVGCVQESASAIPGSMDFSVSNPDELYNIARLLIPTEIGRFELSHVKALLNLAVFNISRSMFSPAWLLVGSASRIFLLLEDDGTNASSRRTNVLASCFLLDNLLALQMQQKSFLDQTDLAWAEKISEEGMEEWKPWSGHTQGSARQVRQPTLALSSFNALLEVTDILVSAARPTTAKNFLHEMIGRLEMWKTSLPSKLEFIRSDSALPPMTPPALLLKLTYFAAAFMLVPSQAWLQRILELLEMIKQHFLTSNLPPITACLLESIIRRSHTLTLDSGLRSRMREVFSGYGSRVGYAPTHPTSIPGTSPVATSLRNHEMNPVSPHSFSSHTGDEVRRRPQRNSLNSTLIDDLLPDMNAGQQRNNLRSMDAQSFDINHASLMLDSAITDPQDPYNAFVSGDLDTFFDDLTSLHGPKKFQNNPQFMQNLGYSSEVSMADLLSTDPGRFMPLTATTGGAESSAESPQFPLHAFYDVG